MEKKQNIQSVDIMKSVQNILDENARQKKEIETIRHNFRNVAYQKAEMAVQLRTLSEKLTTMAQTVNGSPLNQLESLRAASLDSVPCAKPAKQLTEAQRAAYEKRKADTAERKRKEAKSEAIKAAWTPERRAQQAAIMKERRAKQLAESSNEVNN